MAIYVPLTEATSRGKSGKAPGSPKRSRKSSSAVSTGEPSVSTSPIRKKRARGSSLDMGEGEAGGTERDVLKVVDDVLYEPTTCVTLI